MSEIIIKDKQYVANTYNRFPVEVESGNGSVIKDTSGKEYIDFGSGIGVTSFGLCDREWVEAVTKQINTVQHISNLYYTAPCAELAELLCEKTGCSKVFFGNSGAEANECAIKVARKYAAETKGKEYNVIITIENSFHGRTLTTLAATGQAHYHELYNPLTPGFAYVPANNIAALKKAVSEHKVAGIMFECIQGEGGVKNLDAEYIRAIRDISDENDIIVIADEVQTGNGRTGKMYAYMNYGITPDVVTTAKGLGGGLPIGAALLLKKVENVLGFGDHGSTYGGNPVACAGAVSVVRRINDELLNSVAEKGAYVKNELEKLSGVEEVSGMGLMIGIKTAKPAADVVNTCIEKGLLCLTAKDKVRLLPALNIPWDILKKGIEIIKESV